MNLPNQHRAGARTAAQTGRDIPTGKTGKNHWNSRQTSLNTSLCINKLRRGHHMSALWRKEFIRHSRLTPFTKLGVCAAHLAARQRDNNTPSAFSYSWGVKRGHLGRTSAPQVELRSGVCLPGSGVAETWNDPSAQTRHTVRVYKHTLISSLLDSSRHNTILNTWQINNKLFLKRDKLLTWILPIKMTVHVCVLSCVNNEAFYWLWHITISPGTHTHTHTCWHNAAL